MVEEDEDDVVVALKFEQTQRQWRSKVDAKATNPFTEVRPQQQARCNSTLDLVMTPLQCRYMSSPS